jgi:hypothetical protein
LIPQQPGRINIKTAAEKWIKERILKKEGFQNPVTVDLSVTPINNAESTVTRDGFWHLSTLTSHRFWDLIFY